MTRSFRSASRFGFLTKVCLFLTVFILVITAAFTLLFVHYQRGMLNRVLIRNGEVLAQILSRNARLAVLSESDDLLGEVLDSAFSQEKVVQVMVYNDRGDLLTWRARSRHLQTAKEPHPRILQTVAARSGSTSSIYVREKTDVVEFWSSVTPAPPYGSETALFLEETPPSTSSSSGSVAGWIGICVDKQEMEREFRDLLRNAALVGLIFWIAGSLLAIVAIRGFTRPLNRLTAGVIDLEAGGPVTPLPEGRRDELGELARAFNRMAGTIQTKEAALRASEEKYRSIVENATEGIFQIDTRGRIVMANPALAEMLGYDSAQGMVREGIDILRHVSVEAEQRHRIRNGEYAAAFETVCRRTDGNSLPVLVNAHVVRDPEGGVLHYEGLIQDITLWKRAERLKSDKEAAEASALAKSRFLAHMSHEIRTPLGAITGMVEVLSRTDLDPDQMAKLGKIESSARTLVGIIDDILDFSRIEAGKLPVEKVPFAWEPVARQLIHLFSDKAAEKGIDLTFDVSPDFPAGLVGSPLRLKQVLTNLIGNALKFTPAGGRVTVTGQVVEPLAAGDLLLEFKVADTGIGIPREKQASIFESFTQLDDSTSRKYGGTGLGLAICKQLVEMMAGRIQVMSWEGMGTTFSFRVPMARTDLPPAAPEKRETAGPVDLTGVRILVVEDHPINQEVVQNLLEAEGARVTLADNGHTGLAALEKGGFDAVLMDIQMPDMDGITATRRIRESRPELARLPIIAMTAHAMDEEREKYLAAGMVDVVTKPLDLSKLFGALSRCRAAGPGDRETAPRSAGKPGEGDAAAFPAHLPGIDMAEARVRFLGNRRLLARLLRQLAEEYGDAADRFREELAAGRREEAQHLAHTLKGVAGNCSVRPLFRIAADLERLLQEEERMPAPEDLHRLEKAMAAVAAAADQLQEAERPGGGEAEPEPPPLPQEELASRFVDLDLMLERHNVRAEHLFLDLMAGLRDPSHAGLLNTLEEQIRRYRFKEARETLAELAGLVGVVGWGRGAEDGGRRAEDGGRRTGGQRTEDRRQRAEDVGTEKGGRGEGGG